MKFSLTCCANVNFNFRSGKPVVCAGRCYINGVCVQCPPPKSSCFPVSATVHLENMKTITMAELRVGDRVKTGRETKRISLQQFHISFIRWNN